MRRIAMRVASLSAWNSVTARSASRSERVAVVMVEMIHQEKLFGQEADRDRSHRDVAADQTRDATFVVSERRHPPSEFQADLTRRRPFGTNDRLINSKARQ